MTIRSELRRSARRAYHAARQERAYRRCTDGDFDDMGRADVARHYHFNQRRKRGFLYLF